MLPGGRGAGTKATNAAFIKSLPRLLPLCPACTQNPPETKRGIPRSVVCLSLCCPGIHGKEKASQESAPVCRDSKFPLVFPYTQVSKFLQQMLHFKLNTMQIFNLGQKKLQAGFRPWTDFQLFLQVQIQCLHTWMAICLFVDLFTMVIFFIMNLDIFVLCFRFEHKNLCTCNSCTGNFRSFGKRLRSAEDNQCRLNL